MGWLIDEVEAFGVREYTVVLRLCSQFDISAICSLNDQPSTKSIVFDTRSSSFWRIMLNS